MPRAAQEFSIEGHDLVARPMDPRTQLIVLVRVSPLLAAGIGEFLPFIVQMRKEGISSFSDIPLERAAAIVTPIARELAKMKADEMWEIIGLCLQTVEVKSAGGWKPLWNAAAGMCQFQEFNDDLFLMLRVCVTVFERAFTRFFPGNLSEFLTGAKRSGTNP